MHGIVEPEALVIFLGELHVIGVRSLRLLCPCDYLQGARKWKASRFDGCAHAYLPIRGCVSRDGRLLTAIDSEVPAIWGGFFAVEECPVENVSARSNESSKLARGPRGM